MAFPTIIEKENGPITKNQLLRQFYQKYNESYITDDKLEELSNAICYIKNMMFTENEIASYNTSIEKLLRNL